jgi:hypothetical protein
MSASLSAPTIAGAPTAATGASYVQRALNVTVQLGKGSFGTGGFNTVTLSGVRAAATIKRSGAPGFDQASIRVYGLTADVMNSVSTLGVPLPMDRLNNVAIAAGNVGGAMSTVFTGQIQTAYQDFGSAPEISLVISGLSSTWLAALPAPPSSFTGAADAATIISGLATRAGRLFQNSGVQVKLASPYYPGTLFQQAQKCARDAGATLYDDGETWFIWTKTKGRSGSIPNISTESGLIGYPNYTAQGVQFDCLFNPSIVFGGYVNLQTSVTRASGVWWINSLTVDLAAQFPGGPWFCHVGAVRLAQTPASS